MAGERSGLGNIRSHGERNASEQLNALGKDIDQQYLTAIWSAGPMRSTARLWRASTSRSTAPDIPQTKPSRSAIYAIARNLHVGASVWGNPRLPADPLERGVVIMEARNLLTRKLIDAGVM